MTATPGMRIGESWWKRMIRISIQNLSRSFNRARVFFIGDELVSPYFHRAILHDAMSYAVNTRSFLVMSFFRTKSDDQPIIASVLLAPMTASAYQQHQHPREARRAEAQQRWNNSRRTASTRDTTNQAQRVDRFLQPNIDPILEPVNLDPSIATRKLSNSTHLFSTLSQIPHTESPTHPVSLGYIVRPESTTSLPNKILSMVKTKLSS